MKLKTLLVATMLSLATITLFSPESLAGKYGGQGDYEPYSPFGDEILTKGPDQAALIGEIKDLKLPDLVISGYWFLPKSNAFGIRVVNQGNAPSMPCILEWNEMFFSAPTISNSMVPPIAPGTSLTLIKSIGGGAHSDCHRGVFEIDAGDHNFEWVENNNTFYVEVTHGCF